MSGAAPTRHIARYVDGTPMRAGDRVMIEHGRTAGIVEAVIVEADEIAESGVGEAGVLLSSAPFGRVFWPLDYPQDPVSFVERGAPPPC